MKAFYHNIVQCRTFPLLKSYKSLPCNACNDNVSTNGVIKSKTLKLLPFSSSLNDKRISTYMTSSSGNFRQLSTSASTSTKDNKNASTSIPITFYYDTISPYSWLAFEILQRYKPIWDLTVDFKPVFMGGITKENSNKFLESLTSTPNKVQYMFKDLVRQGEFYDVPFRMPESPLYLIGVAGSLKQQRFLTAVKKCYPEYLESCSREFWYRCWSEDLDATKDTSIFMIATRAGLKEEEILNCLEEIQTEELKLTLKNTTTEAVNIGAFGLPFITIDFDNKLNTFWGSDRFEIMANTIGKEWHGPVPDNVCYVPLSFPQNSSLETQEAIFNTPNDDMSTGNKEFSLPKDFIRPP